MVERTFRFESGSNSDGIRLRVMDDVSGVTLASVELTAQQVFDLARGAGFKVDGEQSPHLERVGKTMQNSSWTFEVSSFGKDGWKLSREAKMSRAKDMARTAEPEWDVYEPHMNNSGGVVVVGRRWVAKSVCGITYSSNPGSAPCVLESGHTGNHADGEYSEWGQG